MKFIHDMSESNIASLILSVLLFINFSSASVATPLENDPSLEIQLAENVSR